MVAKVAGSRATTVGKSADVLVVGVPGEWFDVGSEISPIAEIAGIVPEPDQVWFVCTKPADVSTAARIVRSAVEDGAWTNTRPRYLDATEDVGGAVGDLVGDLLAKKERVVVSDVAGAEPVRWAIRRASGYAGIPLLTIGPQREVYVDQLKAATSSLVLGALRFALTAKPSDPGTTSVELHERGFTTLVKAGQDDTYERTLLLDALLADIDLARSSDYSSACADLLERRGFPEDAQRLRGATQYWIQQRLWDANFVPEMVLHNEAHSAAVDRNVASLCEPLLDIKKGRPIDELDLLVLALAAWLHDWGHASATADGSAIATNPIDVRNFHGIFTAARLAGGATEDERHEIDERFAGKGLCGDVYKKGEDWLAKDVALLCAHHQGWTSCGNQPPRVKSIEDPDSLKIKKKNKPGFEVLSFDEDHAQKVDGRDLSPLKLQADLDRAHLRLAILRVADAADVGVHRVPDYRTQQAGRDAIAKNVMEEQKRTIRLILEGRLNQQGQQASTSALQSDLERIESYVANAEKRIRKMVYQGNLPNEEDIKEAFKDSMPGDYFLASMEHSQKWKNPFSADSDAVSSGKAAAVEVTRKAYKYGKHLVTQRAFYDQHEMVRAAIPVLLPPENKGDEWKLVVNVIPNLSDAPDEPPLRENWAAERTERAVRYAMDIVAREFGAFIQEESDGSTRQRDSRKPEDRQKQDIAHYLDDVGVSKTVRGLAVAGSDGQGYRELPAPDTHRTGAVLSPSGLLTVRAVPGGFEIGDSSTSTNRFISVSTEGITALAVDGTADAGRVLVSWDRGTALLREPVAGARVLRLRGVPSMAGVLLPAHGILVNADGVASLVRLDESRRTTPVDWLAGCRVSGMDAVLHEGGFLVAAVCAVDEDHELRAARGHAEDWVSLPPLRLDAHADKVWIARSAEPVRIEVLSGKQTWRYRLGNGGWQAV